MISNDNPETLYESGKKFYEEKNYEKALALFMVSAEQNHADAQNYDAGQGNLGYMYQFGLGVEKDEKKAFEWYELSAKQNNAYAQCRLGYMYQNGLSVKKDEKKAVEWYERSAKQNNATAQDNL